MAAKIGALAPKFKAQAVVNGEIKEISLDDYKVRADGSGASGRGWGGWVASLRKTIGSR